MPLTITERPKISESYLSKAEAALKFNRHEATLTTDILGAMRLKDQEILSLLKLQTKEGKELIGTKVTVDKVKQLRKEGMQPWWFLHPTDVVPLFIKRKSRGVSSKNKTVSSSSSLDVEEGTITNQSPNPVDQMPTEVAVELAVLKKDVQYLREIRSGLTTDVKDLKADNKDKQAIIRKQANTISTNAAKMLTDWQTIQQLQRQLGESSAETTPGQQPYTEARLVESESASNSFWDLHAPTISKKLFRLNIK